MFGAAGGARQGGGPGVGAGGHGGDDRASGGHRRGRRVGKHRRRRARPDGMAPEAAASRRPPISCSWNCRPIAPNPTRWRRRSNIRGATASPTGYSQTPPPWPKPVARLGTGSPQRPTGSLPSCAASGPTSLRRPGPGIMDDYEFGSVCRAGRSSLRVPRPAFPGPPSWPVRRSRRRRPTARSRAGTVARQAPGVCERRAPERALFASAG